MSGEAMADRSDASRERRPSLCMLTVSHAPDVERFALLRHSLELFAPGFEHVAVVDTEDLPLFSARFGGSPRLRLLPTAAVLPAKSWGAHASRLITVLRKGHAEVKLRPEDLQTLVTWVDLNAPYYPSYYCAFPDHLGGRSPLNPAEVKRLSELTGVNLAALSSHGALRQPWLSFDRPALSPALARIATNQPAARAEALALLQAGARRLHETPEADRPGFTPCAADREREAKYVRRRAVEQRNRLARVRGEKVYDE